MDLFPKMKLDFNFAPDLFEVSVHLFLIETSLKQKPGHWVKKRHIGRVRCVVSDHVEQPGKDVDKQLHRFSLKLPHGQLMCKYINHLASFAIPVLSNEWWGVKVDSTQPETRCTYQVNP